MARSLLLSLLVSVLMLAACGPGGADLEASADDLAMAADAGSPAPTEQDPHARLDQHLLFRPAR